MRFIKNAWTIAIPLILVLVAAIVLVLTGHRVWADLVSNFGTLLVMFGNLVYVVFFHSKKRYPGTTPAQRLSRIVTFSK